MLIISEQDIENRKMSVKATLNYYLRQMEMKHTAEKNKNFLKQSCEMLVETLDNLKLSLINIYSCNTEKHAKEILETKRKIEEIFLESKITQNDLIQTARSMINTRF